MKSSIPFVEGLIDVDVGQIVLRLLRNRKGLKLLYEDIS